MARYIVSYDLSQPGQDYDDLYKRIKSYGSWAEVTESSWAIETDQTAKEILDYLKPAMDHNDRLLVGRLGTSAWTGLSKKISDWLRDNR